MTEVSSSVCRCNDCKIEFILEDAKWCDHKIKLGIGSKACPICGLCICHGDTAQKIQTRFSDNLREEKFIKVPHSIFDYQCWTIKQKEKEEATGK